MEKKRVLSAIQPTGDLHYGNYFGAISNWVRLQEDYLCTYGVVDYHAMTMPFSPRKLRENTWDIVFSLLAVGVKVENIFIQSLVPEHAELSWIFNCFCSYGQLLRMTQFKDKSAKAAETDFISVGLLDYPVLQAADILIYRADYVPVGEDQKQHLELTRDIAQRFNHVVGKDYFTLPEVLYTKTPKILSTADPTRKMSKSAGEKHYISVFADEDRIRKQIRSAVTDAGDVPSGKMSPGVENLFELLQAAGDPQGLCEELKAQYREGQLKYVQLKEAVADALVGLSRTFRQRKEQLLENKKDIKNAVKESSAVIRKRARQTVKEVKELTGLLNVKY